MTTPAFPQLRRAQLADAPALAAFAARIFAESFGADNRPQDIAAHLAKSFAPEKQHRELADPDYVTILVFGPEGIAGYAQVRHAAPPRCVTTPAPVELYRFYVDRPWQGQGVAQRHMTAVHAAAIGLGGRSIWLGVWERNPRAIAFYSKCGYRDVGGATFLLGADEQADRVMVALVPAAGATQRPTEDGAA